MRLIRIGTAAVSVKVGDFSGNAARLRETLQAAKDAGVHLLVTPELAISGYSLEDRIFWKDIEKQSWQMLEALAEHCGEMAVLLGLPVRIGPMIYNATALVFRQEVRGLILKQHMPMYGVFYEGRNWTAWQGGVTKVNGLPAGDLVFKLPFGMVSAEICEDLWSTSSPARNRVLAGAEIICNPSASPFLPGKNEERRRLILGTAGSMHTVYAYANLLGCDNSRLVFDGGGIIATPHNIVSEAPILSIRPWTLATGIVDLDDVTLGRAENTTWRLEMGKGANTGATEIVDCDTGTFVPSRIKDYVAQMPKSFYTPEIMARKRECDPYLDDVYAALVLGLRDYFEKVGAFQQYLVALSGGRDSALCLLMAVDAAKALNGGADAAEYATRVSTVYLPNTAYSSAGTEEAARALAEELGVPFQVLGIDEETEIAFGKAAQLAGGKDKVLPLTRQNMQARVRGAMMLNWANNVGGLLLVTSNLSEAAVGYTTTGGDNEGGYSPIANLPKTLVSKLLEYLAKREGIVALEKVLAIPPSAELASDQRDEDDLMPYAVLDDLLYLYARRRLSLSDCWRVACHRHPQHDPETIRAWAADFGRRFSFNQWKRDQHPVALKVMDLDLDPKTGFRFPVTQSIVYELEALVKAELGD